VVVWLAAAPGYHLREPLAPGHRSASTGKRLPCSAAVC